MKKCLVALAFGTLGLGMSEFGMMGILTFVASGLHVSIPQAGHLVSAYALGVCIGAPLTVAVAHTRPLKQILLALAGLMVAGNLCAAFAPNYGVLLAMRFVSGLPHGAYFGVGSIVAARVAGPGRSAQAVAVMIAGMTVANLFGVPLGTLVSHLLSWRALFCIAGVWGAVIIRKTKRCDFPERSVCFCKTKCILGGTPTLLMISQNRPAYAGNVKRRLNTIQTPFALRFVASLPPMLSR